MINGSIVSLSPDISGWAILWRNDERIRKWCRQYTLISPRGHSKWLDKIESDPTIKMFGIRNSERPVGVCGLTSIDKQNQNAEFSLYIAPEYQRKGYGKEALELLLNHGFGDMNLNRIWGESFEGNPAMEMFTQVGLNIEGCHRAAYFRSGKFVNSYVFSILRDEFYADVRTTPLGDSSGDVDSLLHADSSHGGRGPGNHRTGPKGPGSTCSDHDKISSQRHPAPTESCRERRDLGVSGRAEEKRGGGKRMAGLIKKKRKGHD